MPRSIIRDRAIVEDQWVHLDDEAPLVDGDVTVSWQRWQAERDTLRARRGDLGVRIEGDTPIEDVAGDLEHFRMIALHFPAFKDGRCLSQARILRQRYGYAGELRAVGDVLRDQLAYMERVGIDAFEVREDRSIEDALNAFTEFSAHYQVNPGHPIVQHLRRERAAQQPRAATA